MSNFLPHVERLLAAASTPSGTLLLIGGARDVPDVTRSGVHILRLPQLDPLARVDVSGAVCALACLSDERALIGTESGSLLLVALDGSAPLATADAGASAVRAIAVGPDSKLLATASDDGALRVWSREGDALQLVSSRAFGARSLRSVAFDSQGEWIACGGDAGVAHLVRTTNAAGESRDIDVDSGVSSLLFTGEGRVAIGCADGSIRLAFIEGAADAENRAKGAQHELAVRELIMGPRLVDDANRALPRRLFSLGEDGSVKAWDLDSRRRPKTEDVGGQCQGMAFVPAAADARAETRGGALVVISRSRQVAVLGLDEQSQVKGKRTFSSQLSKLEADLKGGSQQARLLALDHVAELAEDEARAMLDAALLGDRDAEVRAAAAAHIALSGRRLSRPALRQALEDNTEGVRGAALSALTELSQDNPLSAARAALVSKHADMRIAALGRMPALCASSPLVPGLVAQGLGDADGKVRLAALDALYEIEGPRSVEPLRVAFARGTPDVRKEALIRASGAGIATTDAVELIEDALDDESHDVRETAFQVAIGAREGLASALRRTPAFAEKLDALAKAGGSVLAGDATASEAERQPLFASLTARHADTAVRGTWALTSIGDPRSVGAMLQLSRDTDAGVRRSVVQLAQYAIKNTVPGASQLRGRIEWLLNDPDGTVRAAAFDALVFLEAEGPDGEIAVGELALRGVHQDIRLRALQILVKFGGGGEHSKHSKAKLADQLLGDALDDEDARVRDEAFRTLWAWHSASPQPALERASRCRHADLRLRIVGEVGRLKEQPWADSLLLRMCADGIGSVGQAAYKQLLDVEANKTRADVHGAALASPSPEVLAKVCTEIDAASFANHRARILDLVEDERPPVHTAAIECFDRHRPSDDVAFQRAFSSIFYGLRVRAMELCGRRRDERCIDPAMALLTLPVTDSNRPADALRQRIARALADVGHSSLVPFFVRLLQDDDALVREFAARGLATAARPGGEQPLVDALAHADLPVRSWVAEGLARLGDPRSLPVLAGTLAHDHRPIRLGAIMGFAALGPEGVRGLLMGLDDQDREIQELVFSVIVARDVALADAGLPPDLLLSSLSSTDAEIRFAAARFVEARMAGGAHEAARELVGPKRPDKAAEMERWPEESERDALQNVLVRALASDDPGQRYAATQVLALRPKPLAYWREVARLRGPSRVGTLRIPHTNWADEAVQPRKQGWLRALVQGLGAKAPNAALQQLVFGVYAGLVRHAPPEGQNDDTQKVRRDALTRLMHLAPDVGRDAVLPVLRRGLNDPHHLVRKSAVAALRGLYDAGDNTPLMLMLQSSAADVGKAAVDELIAAAGRGETGARDRATNALNAPERDVRLHALTRLPTLYEKGSLEPLLAALASRHSDVRLAVVDRLVGSADPRVTEALGKAMESEHEDLQLKAATVLAQRGDPRTLDVLAGMLRSERDALARSASEALVQLATSADVPDSNRVAVRSSVAGAFVARFEDDPDATADKNSILNALARVGSPAAKGLLLDLIQGEDAGLRRAAFGVAEAIGCFGRPLREREGVNRKSYDEKFVLELARVAIASVHADVRQLAVDPLRSVDDPAADGLLAALVDDRNAEVRVAAVGALAFRSEHAPDGKLATEALAAVVREGKRELVLPAAEGLALSGRPEAFKSLLLVLKAGQAHERAASVIALGNLGDPRGLEELEPLAYPTDELEEDDKPLSTLAVEALGRMLGRLSGDDHRRIRDLVERSARQGGTIERGRAIDGLMANADDRSRTLVESIVSDRYDDVGIRVSATTALGKLRNPASVGVLEDAIRDANYNVSAAALGALEKILADDETKVKLLALKSPHSSISGPAADYLAREGDPLAIITQLSQVEQSTLRVRLRRGLIRRNREQPGSIPVAQVSSLLENADAGPRADAAWLAFEAADPALGPSLHKALRKTTDEALQTRARRESLSPDLVAAFQGTLAAAVKLGADLSPLREIQQDETLGADAVEALFQRGQIGEAELVQLLSAARFRERWLSARALAAKSPQKSASLLRDLAAPSAAAVAPLALAAVTHDAKGVLADEKLRMLALPTLLHSKHGPLIERAKDKAGGADRLVAIAALGHAGDAEAVVALQAILGDSTEKRSFLGLGKKTVGESDEVRVAAYKALRKAQRRLSRAAQWEAQQ